MPHRLHSGEELFGNLYPIDEIVDVVVSNELHTGLDANFDRVLHFVDTGPALPAIDRPATNPCLWHLQEEGSLDIAVLGQHATGYQTRAKRTAEPKSRLDR